MKVLTIYAHHNPRSLCHAILERFSAGLADAGHTNEIVDLHAIRWNPILDERDGPNWIDGGVPDDVLDHMNVAASLRDAAASPVRRWLLERWIGGRDARGIVEKIHATPGPKDVAEQQAKVASAQALAFIAPMYTSSPCTAPTTRSAPRTSSARIDSAEISSARHEGTAPRAHPLRMDPHARATAPRGTPPAFVAAG